MSRVVLANGCFDPLHYGHLLHLEAARRMGQSLVVGLTNDRAVRTEKGAGRPAFRQDQRASMLRALRCVDEVVIVSGVMEALRRVRPDVFVKGRDYVGRIDDRVRRYCEANGIQIRFTDTAKFSATGLLDELRGR